MPRSGLRFLLLPLLVCSGACLATAQTAVLDVTYGDAINGADTSGSGLPFLNEYRPVTSLGTSDGGYQFSGPVAQDVLVRRAGSGPSYTTVVHQTDANGQAYGSPAASIEQLFLSDNLYQGLRDPFANGTSYIDSNIERIDFYLPNYTVQDGDALVFFDLKNDGGGGFRIAAFTDWSTGTERPTAYANTGLLVGAGAYGSALDSPSDNFSREYLRATYNTGDNLTSTPFTAALTGDLGLAGVLVRFTDLGLEAGSTIQGFSIMAGDVAATSSASLVDWTQSNVYRNNTTRATWGSTDFMAIGARVAQPIPEPSTYGALLMGLLGAGYGWRRWRSSEWGRGPSR